uniref:endo-polygalacturonase n=1 Tax=Peronospora matthiolae TaxID=2874970 RepID=A0AAV1T6V9_9STRA
MKFGASSSFALCAFALFAAAVTGDHGTEDSACEMSPLPERSLPEQKPPGGKTDIVYPVPRSRQKSGFVMPDESVCVLKGTYINGTDVSQCKTIIIDSLHVPAGVMLNLTNVTDGAYIKFIGISTFDPEMWEGPLIKLTGNNLTVTGPGILDGQGAWYWPYGKNITRPVFFRLNQVANSVLSGFTIRNMPFRTFSILSSNYTTLSDLTIDSRAGNGIAKNTDGFDLGKNDHVTITRNRVINQDDCLAMQSSTNTVFSFNYCNGSHGISIGSLGGPLQNINTTVDNLLVLNNVIENSSNGLRIKTIIDLKGLVTNVRYINNRLVNVKHAIVIHSDYNKTRGGYSGQPTSLVKITNITIDGLFGSALNLYDIKANPDVVSNLKFTNIAVNVTNIGNCTGAPSNVQC